MESKTHGSPSDFGERRRTEPASFLRTAACKRLSMLTCDLCPCLCCCRCPCLCCCRCLRLCLCLCLRLFLFLSAPVSAFLMATSNYVQQAGTGHLHYVQGQVITDEDEATGDAPVPEGGAVDGTQTLAMMTDQYVEVYL